MVSYIHDRRGLCARAAKGDEMNGFVEVAKNVYYLAPPVPEFGGGVTLVTATSGNILIDCGAFDYSVTKFIAPALKGLKLDVKNISYLFFTHCSHDNIGGVHKLKQLNPDIRIMTFSGQAERLKNPTNAFLTKWNDYLDYSPPFRELRGILPNAAVNAEDEFFKTELVPKHAEGHDEDCVCWYHMPSGTMISGDAIQGNGTDETGMAFITSLERYRNTLDLFSEEVPKNMICSKDFRGCPAVIIGEEECRKAIETSYDALNEYIAFVDRYAKLVRKKKENLDPIEVVNAYFENKKKPAILGYAIRSMSEFLKLKR